MSDIQVIITSFGCGLRDALHGIVKIRSLDQGLEDENEAEQEREQPMSILAQRRVERNKGREVEMKTAESQKLIPRLLECIMFNGGICLSSNLLFVYGLVPGVKVLMRMLFGESEVLNISAMILYAVVGTFWILPLYLVSKIMNSFGFQDIANSAYRKRRGRPIPLPSISSSIADILFSLVLQAFFLIQSIAATIIPIPGVSFVFSHIHLSLLYSLYAFEYKWYNMGWPLQKRLAHIQDNWAYYVGFGSVLSILTSVPESSLHSGSLFSIFFPMFIISANEAPNVPEPSGPTLRIFSPVIMLTNKVFNSSVNIKPHATPPQQPAASSSTKRVTMQEQRR